MGLSEDIQKQVLEKAINSSQIGQQIIELKQQNNLKLQIKYCEKFLLNQNCYHLLFNRISSDQHQFSSFAEGHLIQFVETTFPPIYSKLIMKSEQLPLNLEKFTDVSCCNQLSSYCDYNMTEMRRRQNTCVIAYDRPGYQTSFISHKLAMRLNMKFTKVGDHSVESQQIYKQFVGELQYVVLDILQAQLRQQQVNYLIFVSDRYLRENEVVQSLCQILQCCTMFDLFNIDTEFVHQIMDILRQCNQQNDFISDIQMKYIAFDLFKHNIKFILSPENDCCAYLDPLSEYCVKEQFSRWTLLSIASASLITLPDQYSQMKELCKNKDIFKAFITTFQLLINSISFSQKLYDVLFSPGFFQRFLIEYYTIYYTKRNDIQKKLKQYQKGIELYNQSQSQLTIIQTELQTVKPKVQQLQIDTDNLLVQLTDKKQEIQQRQKEVKIEDKELQLKFQQVEFELANAQSELDEVMPLLIKAGEALKQITRQEIAEISSFTNPKPQIQLVMSAICVILGQNTNWATARQLLSSGNLIIQLLNVKPLEVSTKQMKNFKHILANDQFNVDSLRQVSLAASLLANWCISVVQYCDAYQHVNPRIIRLNNAKQEYQQNLQQIEVKKAEIIQLRKELERVEKQLEIANVEKAKYQQQMDNLVQQQTVVLQLTKLLADQYDSWKQKVLTNNQLLDKLSILSLLSTTYSFAQFSNQYSQIVENITAYVKQQLSFSDTDTITIQQVYNFIADQYIISKWKSNGLYGDLSISTAMNALQTIVVTPYILDPDLVFLKALQHMQIKIIDIDNEDWYSSIQPALGQPITIALQTQNIMNLPNFLKIIMSSMKFDLSQMFSTNEKQKQEYNTIVYNGSKVEVNRLLQFIIIDNENQALQQVPVEVFSKFHVISFLKDGQSIIEQIQNVIVESTSNEFEQKRQQAIQNQANLELQLQDIEQSIIVSLQGFDFQKQLLQSQTTIIPQLVSSMNTKESIQQQLQQISSQNSQYVELKQQQYQSAKVLSSYYQAICYYVDNYNLQQFCSFIKTFISIGLQCVVDNILLSIPQQYLQYVKFYTIALLQQNTDSKYQLLLQSLRECIANKAPLTIFNKDTNMFYHKEYQIAEFSGKEKQVQQFIAASDEQSFDFVARCYRLIYLFCGFIKQQENQNTSKDTLQSIDENNIFYRFFQSRVLDMDQYSDINAELQYQIRFSMQTQWKTHYLKLYEKDYEGIVQLADVNNIEVPQYYATIYHLVQNILKNSRLDDNDNSLSSIQKYLTIAFVKFLKPNYFDQSLKLFISREEAIIRFDNTSATPQSALHWYIQSNAELFLCGPQCVSIQMVSSELEKYKLQYDENSVKPDHPAITISSLQTSTTNWLNTLVNDTMHPQWIVLLNVDYSDDKDLQMLLQIITIYHQAKQKNTRLIILGNNDFTLSHYLPSSQVIIQQISKVFVSIETNLIQIDNELNTLELNTQFSSQVNIQQYSDVIQNLYKGFVLGSIFGVYQITTRYIDFWYFRYFYINSAIESLLYSKCNMQDDDLSSRISFLLQQLFGSSLSQQQKLSIYEIVSYVFKQKQEITSEIPAVLNLPQQRLNSLYRKRTNNNLEIKYQYRKLLPSLTIKEYIDAPLNQFLLNQHVELNQILNLRNIQNIAQFFTILQLQACSIYGYTPTDYKIAFTTNMTKQQCDLFITGWQPINLTCKISQQVKVIAILRYKRRDVFLPLFQAPMLNNDKLIKSSKRLKIFVPGGETNSSPRKNIKDSEFSIGSEPENSELKETKQDKPLKERRICQFLTSSVKLCQQKIELRRKDEVVGEIFVDLGGDENILLSGGYLDV